MLERMWGKGNPLCSLGENINDADMMEKSMELSQNIKNRTTI